MWRRYNPGTLKLIEWYNAQLFGQNQPDADANAAVVEEEDRIAARMRRLEDSFGLVGMGEPESIDDELASGSAPKDAEDSVSFLTYVSAPNADVRRTNSTSEPVYSPSGLSVHSSGKAAAEPRSISPQLSLHVQAHNQRDAAVVDKATRRSNRKGTGGKKGSAGV